jgi:hypothetical protein
MRLDDGSEGLDAPFHGMQQRCPAAPIGLNRLSLAPEPKVTNLDACCRRETEGDDTVAQSVRR